MTLFETISLFLIMAALAALPSSSVGLVIARSAMTNTRNGFATSAGIVAGDLVFVFLAVLGMTAIAEWTGAFFTVIRYAAAAYLIWFGYTLIHSQFAAGPARGKEPVPPQTAKESGSLFVSFTAGLFLTLGDVKAIIFYASLFPTFLDLSTLTAFDLLVVTMITIIAVGGVKCVYALLAVRLARASSALPHQGKIKTAAGGMLICAGGYLALKG